MSRLQKAVLAAIAAFAAALLGGAAVNRAKGNDPVQMPCPEPDQMVSVRLPDAPPGKYTVEVHTVRLVDGVPVVSKLVRVVTVGAAVPPVVPPAVPPAIPPAVPDAAAAIGRIQFGAAGCTATVIEPRRPDGRYDVLTAGHCVTGTGQKGTLVLKDGRRLGVTAVRRDPLPSGSDLCWLVTDDPGSAPLPVARLAAVLPAAGTPVWHQGYGVDRPGNRESGTVVGNWQNGQLEFRLSVSSGDSGGGIFRADTNELVAAVCCTRARGLFTSMYGGHALSARSLRPGAVADEWEPLPLPIQEGN